PLRPQRRPRLPRPPLGLRLAGAARRLRRASPQPPARNPAGWVARLPARGRPALRHAAPQSRLDAHSARPPPAHLGLPPHTRALGPLEGVPPPMISPVLIALAALAAAALLARRSRPSTVPLDRDFHRLAAWHEG